MAWNRHHQHAENGKPYQGAIARTCDELGKGRLPARRSIMPWTHCLAATGGKSKCRC